MMMTMMLHPTQSIHAHVLYTQTLLCKPWSQEDRKVVPLLSLSQDRLFLKRRVTPSGLSGALAEEPVRHLAALLPPRAHDGEPYCLCEGGEVLRREVARVEDAGEGKL